MATREKSIVVVGSGIGGSGVAALLQARGHKVTLLEKNDYFGGKCTSFQTNGFVVDYAFHIYSTGEKGPLGEISRRVQGDLQWIAPKRLGKLEIHPGNPMEIPVNWSTALRHGMISYLTRAMRPGLITSFGHSVRNLGFMGLLDIGRRVAKQDENFFQSLDDTTSYDFLCQFTENRDMHRLFALLSGLAFVMPHTESSAGELMWCTAKQFDCSSLGLPKGGAKEIAGSYIRAFKRDGGIVRSKCEVKHILVKNGTVRGVETKEGEEIKADIVISNAGIQRTMELAGEKHFPEEYVSYVKKLKYPYAAIILKMGLDRRVEGLPSHLYCYVPTSEEIPNSDFGVYLRDRRIPNDISYSIVMPSDFDPSICPPGKHLLVAGSVGPCEITPENVKYCDKLLDKLESGLYERFPQIKDHVEFKMRVNINNVASASGRPYGECVGLAQCPGQTGLKKPSPITPIKDLWLVGCDAGARGIGTEQAANSALYVANMLG